MSQATQYKFPIIPILETRAEWHVAKEGGDDNPRFSFVFGPREGEKWTFKQIRAADVYRDFMSVKRPQDAEMFFSQYGPWQVESPSGNRADPFTFQGLIDHQQTIKDLILGEKMDLTFRLEAFFFWQPLQIEIPAQYPLVGFVRCKDIQDAIRACVFLDKLDGTPIVRCARIGCPNTFKAKRKGKKKYCKTACATHARVAKNQNDQPRRIAQAANLWKRWKRTKNESRVDWIISQMNSGTNLHVTADWINSNMPAIQRQARTKKTE